MLQIDRNHLQELQGVFTKAYQASLKNTTPARSHLHARHVTHHYAENTYPGEDFDWVWAYPFDMVAS